MAPNFHSHGCSYHLFHEADSGQALDRNVLARIHYGTGLATSPDPREINVALPQTGGAPVAEVWRSHRPVEHGWADGLGYAHNGEVVFGHVRLDEHDLADLVRATARAYLRIDLLLRRLGYPCWLRMWNFLGHINHGEGDTERYRQFSQGRHNALALKPGFETRLPAATAIGTQEGGMTVYFLAARDPGAQVENPRQVSAFRYPAAYGPKSPSFSRGCLKHWADSSHLFVSGTASVVGHQTLHPGDLLAQLDETHRNFEALLGQASALEPAAGPFSAVGLKVYVRPGHDSPELLPRVRRLFGDQVPVLCLAGDICRRDLLLEIEGLFTATAHSVSLQAVA
ncbi:MAG: hypothetical protein ACSLFJ_10555 [Immundisolibacter sp.]|uniref:chorismate transformation enzyme, FkbO/Hyg5 family n=1 Tax=Immundisolibacter sp. TaxID=1934948 RepID=UPI003EDF3B48